MVLETNFDQNITSMNILALFSSTLLFAINLFSFAASSLFAYQSSNFPNWKWNVR